MPLETTLSQGENITEADLGHELRVIVRDFEATGILLNGYVTATGEVVFNYTATKVTWTEPEPPE